MKRRDFLRKVTAGMGAMALAGNVMAEVEVICYDYDDREAGKSAVSAHGNQGSSSAVSGESGKGDVSAITGHDKLMTGSKGTAGIMDIETGGDEKTIYSERRADFKVSRGEKLSEVLERWARKVGGHAIWRADRDFVINGSAQFVGDLPGAVRSLIDTLGYDVEKHIVIEVFANGYIQVKNRD